MIVSDGPMRLELLMTGPGPVPFLVEWEYLPHDPAAVAMTIHDHRARPRRAVRWTFAREVLADGIRAGGAGPGDVHVTACLARDELRVQLWSPTGYVQLIGSAHLVNRWLADTYLAVPIAAENRAVRAAAEQLDVATISARTTS